METLGYRIERAPDGGRSWLIMSGETEILCCSNEADARKILATLQTMVTANGEGRNGPRGNIDAPAEDRLPQPSP